MGAVVSRPGARAQRFHADADDEHFRAAAVCPRTRLYNVFAPLVDIAAESDGTQFWPGSHLEGTRVRDFRAAVERAVALDGRVGHLEDEIGSSHLEDDELVMAAMEAPACPAGGLYIFDYRTLHRGLPNAGRERAVAYAILSTGWASDTTNFNEQCSVWALADGLPPTSDDEGAGEEREERRRALGGSFLTWGEIYEREEAAERFLEPRERRA